jgi:transcriptional regulator with XRE-family HTH domain
MAVGTTRGKRRLGRYIRPIRERSGLNAEQVASKALCSRQTVSRLEAGDHLPRLPLFKKLLTAIGATKEERTQALQLWEVADASSVEHGAHLSANYYRFRLDEAEAVLERTLDTVIIPGLLQTPEYAIAVSNGAKRMLTSERWERLAASERRNRQRLLTRQRNPLQFHALVDEAALRRMIGGAEVMAAQLDHMLEALTWPNVVIQVLPFDAGSYGPLSGPMVLLHFPEEDDSDSAYVESIVGVEIVAESSDVAALIAVWDDIAAVALSPKRSVEIIKAARESLRNHGPRTRVAKKSP